MGDFHEITSTSRLALAWRKVKANQGAAGIDSVSIKNFETDFNANISELSRDLRSKRYKPLPPRFVSIVKRNGKWRELGILSVRDRVAQRALLDHYEADFESRCQESSYAFRKGRNVEMAIQRILLLRANGYDWTLESDIASFFPSIPIVELKRRLLDVLKDKEVFNLACMWIDSGMLTESIWSGPARVVGNASTVLASAIGDSVSQVVPDLSSHSGNLDDLENLTEFGADEMDTSYDEVSQLESLKTILRDGISYAITHRALLTSLIGSKALVAGAAGTVALVAVPPLISRIWEYVHPDRGLIQGSPLSPVLANFYLNDFDSWLDEVGFELVRYCDDFVVPCRSYDEASKAKSRVESKLAQLGLSINTEKTRILAPTENLEFLGYQISPDGSVVAPPTVAKETYLKIVAMAKNASTSLQEKARGMDGVKVRKLRFASWDRFAEFIRNKTGVRR